MITKTLVMKDDIMFKAFFSKNGNEKFLKDFLNAILGMEIKIRKVIHDARLEQLAREQKYGILDLEVELETGEIINIEMQMDNHRNMEKRTTFYAGKKLSEQLGPKAKYSDLKKIIVISILNYSFINLPIFADVRASLPIKGSKFTPFVDVRAGYSLLDVEGFYFNPSLGLRIGGKRIGASFSVGYEMQSTELYFKYEDKVYNGSGNVGALKLRIGFEF